MAGRGRRAPVSAQSPQQDRSRVRRAAAVFVALPWLLPAFAGAAHAAGCPPSEEEHQAFLQADVPVEVKKVPGAEVTMFDANGAPSGKIGKQQIQGRPILNEYYGFYCVAPAGGQPAVWVSSADVQVELKSEVCRRGNPNKKASVSAGTMGFGSYCGK